MGAKALQFAPYSLGTELQICLGNPKKREFAGQGCLGGIILGGYGVFVAAARSGESTSSFDGRAVSAIA